MGIQGGQPGITKRLNIIELKKSILIPGLIGIVLLLIALILRWIDVP